MWIFFRIFIVYVERRSKWTKGFGTRIKAFKEEDIQCRLDITDPRGEILYQTQRKEEAKEDCRNLSAKEKERRWRMRPGLNVPSRFCIGESRI